MIARLDEWARLPVVHFVEKREIPAFVWLDEAGELDGRLLDRFRTEINRGITTIQAEQYRALMGCIADVMEDCLEEDQD